MSSKLKVPRREDIYFDIGVRIRVLREARGMSQQDVGDFLGVTRASICNVESGMSRAMVHDLVKLADLFCVPVTALLPPQDGRRGKLLKRTTKLP